MKSRERWHELKHVWQHTGQPMDAAASQLNALMPAAVYLLAL